MGEDYQSDKASDEQILQARKMSPIKSYGDEPPADIKPVSDRVRVLYYKRFCELVRVGLVPTQIYPVMESEAEERTAAAQAAYDQEVADEKQKQQQATLNMWMQSQADDVSSQGAPEPSPTPVKIEKPNPDPMVIAGSPIEESPALSLSPSLLPPLPPQTAGSPQPRLASIAGQAQSAWWMAGQVPPPIGSSNPINPYDSPKVNNIKAETPKLSPVKSEPGTGVVNPYAPTGNLPVVPTDNVHRAIEALDGRKRHKWAGRKSHRSSLLS